jgi:heme exporter protein CcmD
MAGHGPYVWASYAAFTLVLGAMIIAPLWRLAALKRRLKQRYVALEKAQAVKE